MAAFTTAVGVFNIASALTSAASLALDHYPMSNSCEIGSRLIAAYHNLDATFKELRDFSKVLSEPEAKTLTESCNKLKADLAAVKPIAKKRKFIFFKTEEWKTQLQTAQELVGKSDNLRRKARSISATASAREAAVKRARKARKDQAEEIEIEIRLSKLILSVVPDADERQGQKTSAKYVQTQNPFLTSVEAVALDQSVAAWAS
ncbi:hypothetical protein DXG01_010783 [Tephrocybe rancida]|nr:hypothetical protein DXG01_010783 [Tephrocybe rancida]